MLKKICLFVIVAVIVIGGTQVRAATIAYWQMDEATSGRVVSLTDSVTGYDAASPRDLNQQVGWSDYSNVSMPVAPGGVPVAGNVGYMTVYGGQGMYNMAPGFLDDDSFTAEIFYRRDDADGTGCLFGNGHSSGYESIAYAKVLGDGSIELKLTGDDVGVGGNSSDIISAAAPDDTGWHHLAFTYDGTNVKTYVDYLLADTTAPVYYNGRVFSDYSFMQLGWSNAGGPEYHFTGGLDELRFSDTVLAPSQFLGSAVPEPATIVLLGIGALAGIRRKRS